MRILKEYTDKPFKTTIFSWNGKYLIKLEHGPFEQTIKVSEMDVLEEELEGMLNTTFYEKAKNRFDDMGLTLREMLS